MIYASLRHEAGDDREENEESSEQVVVLSGSTWNFGTFKTTPSCSGTSASAEI